jgi:hypothetical protein
MATSQWQGRDILKRTLGMSGETVNGLHSLGTGGFATAFEWGDRVLKVTDDPATIRFLRWTRKNPSPHWPVVYGIIPAAGMKDYKRWVIVTERLDRIGFEVERQSGNLGKDYIGKPDTLSEWIDEHLDRLSDSLIDALRNLCDFVWKGSDERITIGLDICGSNVMERDGTIVLNDPVYEEC